jgi:L-asparagine oxygenase
MTTYVVPALDCGGFMRFSSPPSLSTMEVAQSIGEVLLLEGISPVQALQPRESNERMINQYSGIYGTHTFPMHTDMAHWHSPPHYFLLRCVVPANNVATNLVHSRDLLETEADLTLKRALFRPRRRQDGRLTCFRIRDGECHRWDPIFIQPVNTLASDLRSRIVSRLEKVHKQSIFLTAPGDCIIVDNWKMLHGRSNVPPNAMHRRLERVYLGALYS